METSGILKQHISINEIAEANEVSLSTVYRVMRGAEKNRNPRHLRVRAMLANAGYLPGSKQIFSPLLLVALPGLSSHSFALINFIRNICAKNGIELILSLFNTYEQELRSRPISGIISLAEIDSPSDVPCVYLNIRDITGKHSSVCVNHFQNILNIFTYVKSLGFRRIGYFSDYQQLSRQRYLKCGLISLPMLYELSNLEFNQELIYDEQLSPETHHAACHRAAEYFARLKPRPEAVIMHGDIYAPSFIQAIQELGVRVPEEICVAAVDDSAKYPLPHDSTDDPLVIQLSTEISRSKNISIIHAVSPLREMAEAAVDLLKEHIRDPGFGARQVTIEPGISNPSLTNNQASKLN
ncbi:MAG: LacI family DNA-binding transcriptional regulator [Lentisphaerota bacterium]